MLVFADAVVMPRLSAAAFAGARIDLAFDRDLNLFHNYTPTGQAPVPRGEKGQ